MTCRRVTAALGMLVVLAASHFAVAQSQCRGTQRWHAGACRYPDEIKKMKTADAARAAAAKKNRQQARKKAADEKACSEARSRDTAEAWQSYLASHAYGVCASEAQGRIAELSKPVAPIPEPPAPSEVTPPSPDPDPAASAPAPVSPGSPSPVPLPDDDDSSSNGTATVLTIAGFSLAGAGLVIFAVGGGIALSQDAILDEKCPNQVCQPEQAGELDSALAAAHATTAGLAIFGAGAALGIVGLIIGSSSSEAATRPVTTKIGLGSFTLEGAF